MCNFSNTDGNQKYYQLFISNLLFFQKHASNLVFIFVTYRELTVDFFRHPNFNFQQR